MDKKLLNCYCDHCANNTCTTNQLCYAEWKLVNYDEVASNIFTTETTLNTNHSLNPLVKLEKTFNCYRKNDPLLIRTICNQTASNTSHIIRRCCQSGDYCNQLDNLLPTEQEAREEIQRILPTAIIVPHNATTSLYEQYSDLPLTVQIVIIVIIVALILYLSLLMNQGAGPSTSKRQRTLSASPPPASRGRDHSPFDYNIKRVINTFLKSVGIRRDNARRSVSEPVEGSPSVAEMRLGRALGRGQDDEGSENQEAASYDTNSMASREPLIRNMKITPLDTMNVIHSHPHTNKEFVNGRHNTTLQVTLGSGVVEPSEDTSSGSGQGQAYLSQRSVSYDIQLVKIIGRGFFGVVWRGEYKGQPVAVKIFSSAAEASWERETEIYQTTMLRHKNILGLVAIDRRHDSLTAGFWLVTDFYPMGSLFDFLSKNTISMWDAVRMAFSIANGLAHLHVEIFGTRAKPAIAHRDMKSKNILVKNDGTCCIADLGMAVRFNSSTGIVDVPSNTRIGTRRYLAPEILEDKLNLLDFEAVKAADMYALGLVLWEILRRTCLVSPHHDNVDAFIERDVAEPSTSGSSLYQENVPYGPWPPPGWLQRRRIEPQAPPEERRQQQQPQPEPPMLYSQHQLRQQQLQQQQPDASNSQLFMLQRQQQLLQYQQQLREQFPPPLPNPQHQLPSQSHQQPVPLHHPAQAHQQPGPLHYPAHFHQQPGPFQHPAEAYQQPIPLVQPAPAHQQPEPHHQQQQPHQHFGQPQQLPQYLQQPGPNQQLPQQHSGQQQGPLQQHQVQQRQPKEDDQQPSSHPPEERRHHQVERQAMLRLALELSNQHELELRRRQAELLQRQQGQHLPGQQRPGQNQSEQQQPEQQQPEQQQQPEGQQEYDPEEFLYESTDSLDSTHQLAFAYDDFEVPYQRDVPTDPSAADMYEAVCVKKLRPRKSDRWMKFASMRDYYTLMIECWYEKPQARLSALRLRKSLGDLADKYFNLNIMEYD